MGVATIVLTGVLGAAAVALNIYSAIASEREADEEKTKRKDFEGKLTASLAETASAQKQLVETTAENSRLNAKLAAQAGLRRRHLAGWLRGDLQLRAARL